MEDSCKQSIIPEPMKEVLKSAHATRLGYMGIKKILTGTLVSLCQTDSSKTLCCRSTSIQEWHFGFYCPIKLTSIYLDTD